MTGTRSSEATKNPLLRAGVYLIFTVSGACGLIYQVLWVRELTLVLGVSTYAICTVLSAFMAGLGIGSYLFGRIAVHCRNPLALYGWLEVGIGICGFCLPFLFKGLMGFYAQLYGSLSPHPGLFILVRFFLIELLLLVPCTLMGGTISVLSKYFSREMNSLSRDIGKLYALNTLGAMAGCVAAGFCFIPEFGLTSSTLVVVSANLAVGALAFGLQRLSAAGAASAAGPAGGATGGAETSTGAPTSKGAAPPTRAPATDPAAPRRAYPPAFLKAVLLVFALSGFCSLGYEVLWTRTLVFYLHNSTYAFTTMLATFLLGISLGSMVLNRWIDRSRRPTGYLVMAEVFIGLFTAFSLVLYPALPLVLNLYLGLFEMDGWIKAILLQFSQCVLIVLPATFLMGLTFPVVTRLCVTSLEAVSRSVGSLYAMNTFGCIFGSLLVGFFLLPWLGLLNAFVLLISLNLVLGLVVLLLSGEFGLRAKGAGALAVVALLILLHPLLPSDLFLKAFRRGNPILFYRDGVTDTVMVKAAAGDPSQRALCFTDARGTAGTNTNAMNRFIGHLSLFLHDDPEAVLCICFGVGNTLSAIAVHPEVERLDCVELSENVIAAAPYFPTNEGVLENPKVKIIIQDGRNHLLGSDRRYDVIQMEPPEIHTEGVINLYTREFYALCDRRLNEGGVLCQWMNVAMMPLREQKMLIRTFREVFPHTTAWLLNRSMGHVLLIGTREAQRIHYGKLKERFTTEPVATDLKTKSGLPGPLRLLESFFLTEEGVRRFTEGAQVVTDDHTRVDFSAPRSIDANYGLSNAFSGYRISCLLGAGRQATLDYYADKLLEMTGAMESAFPILTGFDSEEEAAGVKKALDEALEAWKAGKRREAEDIRKQEQVFSNF